MKGRWSIIALLSLIFVSCHEHYVHKTVICIPVYGQSLALGEEAKRLTNFDSLSQYASGRIVTQDLDHDFGYFDNNKMKERAKKAIRYQKRSFELSIYSMAELLADSTGNDTLICIFPGGQGASTLANLSKGTNPYQQFINNIATACHETRYRGWEFYVPAICWMQGESDIVDYPPTDYQQLLKQVWRDMNTDILCVTGQKDSIPFICYQASSLSRAEHFRANNFICPETNVPQTFVNLLRDNSHFWASGPTYPYSCVNEKIHIDAHGQQSIGRLAARSVLGIMRGKERNRGLIPIGTDIHDTRITIYFNDTGNSLLFDTIQVNKAEHWGFSVINKENKNIVSSVLIFKNAIHINCSQAANGCKIRYGINGDYMKSGRLHGPRGNLRDAIGNWCYQFELSTE